jgi:sugar lactone lactonase YvrE
LADGKGRAARFFRPVAIDVSRDGRSVAVADTGNNRCLTITLDGEVLTVGRISKSKELMSDIWTLGQQEDGIVFDEPRSVSFDGVGNLYVVDKKGVQVITGALSDNPQVVSLAQAGSFRQAASVVVSGTRTFVLDTSAASEAEAVKVVTVGAPEISSMRENPILLRPSVSLEGGTEIILTGKNFAPETQVVLGDTVVKDSEVMSATEIRFNVPPQKAPGQRTLSIRTRGGVAQRKFSVVSLSLSELADGEITTVAGGVPFLGDGGRASDAILNFTASAGITSDLMGNLFIADSRNNRVRKIDANTNIITTVAGNGIAGFDGDNGLAISASLDEPVGVAVDQSGNLLISDRGNNQIRRVDARTGNISTVAGNRISGFSGDNGPATQASLSAPTSLAVDKDGNLFIADTANNRVRRVDAISGMIDTVAGNGKGAFLGDNGPPKAASLNNPRGLAVDESGNLFISDSLNNRIRRVDSGMKSIITVAGNGGGTFSGDNGLAIGASLNAPENIVLDASGNLLFSDRLNNRIRRVNISTGIITTIAGNGFTLPSGLTIDGAGNLFITDTQNNRIRRIDPGTEDITTLAGTDRDIGDGDKAVNVSLGSPSSLVIDSAGNMLIADAESNRVRRVDRATGVIRTVAGNGIKGNSGDDEPAERASLNEPNAVAVDAEGNFFIADTGNNRIRRVDARTGNITTVAGTGEAGLNGDNLLAKNANLNRPRGVAVDSSGNLFIADTANNLIRRVDAKTQIINVVAGNGTSGFSGDNVLATSTGLSLPFGVAVDRAGNFFIADSFNNRIRRVDALTKMITTVAGNGTRGFSGDGGAATASNMDTPLSVAVDEMGNMFITDSLNDRVRRVDSSRKVIATIAGNGARDYNGDNGQAINASLNTPQVVAVDRSGNLFIADSGNSSIRATRMPVGGNQTEVNISSASFTKPNLVINGSGFGSSGAIVSVNGRDISALATAQTDSMISLKGNKKKLNLRNGPNQVTVIVGGVSSNTFVLNLAAEFLTTKTQRAQREKESL